MTKKELQTIAKEVMEGGQSYEVVFKPNNNNTISTKDPIKQ